MSNSTIDGESWRSLAAMWSNASFPKLQNEENIQFLCTVQNTFFVAYVELRQSLSNLGRVEVSTSNICANFSHLE